MFKSVENLPLTDYYSIAFAAPFVTTIMAFIVFKERTSITEWMAIIIGFAGVMIIIKPDYAGFNWDYIYPLGAVFSVSTAAILVRKIGKEEDPYLFVIFGSLAVLLAYIIPALNHPLPDIKPHHILIFCIYSFTIPTAVLTLSAVFARAPSVASVVPFQYTQIIWGAIIGYFVFHDVPEINTIIGSAIVIACGLYILFHHKRKRRYELGK
jgi:S-adenosylmethionine uptake transporter